MKKTEKPGKRFTAKHAHQAGAYKSPEDWKLFLEKQAESGKIPAKSAIHGFKTQTLGHPHGMSIKQAVESGLLPQGATKWTHMHHPQ